MATLEEVKAFISSSNVTDLLELEKTLENRYDNLNSEEEREGWQETLINPIYEYLAGGNQINIVLQPGEDEIDADTLYVSPLSLTNYQTVLQQQIPNYIFLEYSKVLPEN